jgi:LysM repeat protein
MQHENSDDPFGFWKDEPTRPLKRTHVGTRAHSDTRIVPVVRTEHARPIPLVRAPRNPLVTRIGLMVGVGLLLVPVALSLRTDKQRARAADIQGVDTVFVGKVPLPAPTAATAAPDTAAPTTIAETTTVVITSAPTEAVVATPEPTEPATTAAKKKKAATTSTQATNPAPTATQSAARSCAMTYTIVKNDTWSTIASRAKVTMKSLLAANDATVNTLLLPGKNVCLPDGAVAPGPPATNTATTKPPSTTQPTTTQPKPATTQPTTPPGTTSPGTTQPAPPANTYTKAQVAQIIREVWPDDLEDEAIRIATRESNLIPTVRNSCCYGLFQIYYNAHRTWLASMGITSAAQLYDPRINATAALALYNNSGWAPWATTAATTTIAAV